MGASQSERFAKSRRPLVKHAAPAACLWRLPTAAPASRRPSRAALLAPPPPPPSPQLTLDHVLDHRALVGDLFIDLEHLLCACVVCIGGGLVVGCVMCLRCALCWGRSAAAAAAAAAAKHAAASPGERARAHARRGAAGHASKVGSRASQPLGTQSKEAPTPKSPQQRWSDGRGKGGEAGQSKARAHSRGGDLLLCCTHAPARPS